MNCINQSTGLLTKCRLSSTTLLTPLGLMGLSKRSPSHWDTTSMMSLAYEFERSFCLVWTLRSSMLCELETGMWIGMQGRVESNGIEFLPAQWSPLLVWKHPENGRPLSSGRFLCRCFPRSSELEGCWRGSRVSSLEESIGAFEGHGFLTQAPPVGTSLFQLKDWSGSVVRPMPFNTIP